MADAAFVDIIKSKDLKGALRRIKSRINGLENNSMQSLAVIPSDEKVRTAIDNMALAELKRAKKDVEARIKEESQENGDCRTNRRKLPRAYGPRNFSAGARQDHCEKDT